MSTLSFSSCVFPHGSSCLLGIYDIGIQALVYRTGLTRYREPIDFYADSVHFLNGFFAAALFLSGVFLSDSILGGLFTILMFAFNYGHSTRAYWSFPLREAFGNPFWFSQLAVFTVYLKRKEFVADEYAPSPLKSPYRLARSHYA